MDIIEVLVGGAIGFVVVAIVLVIGGSMVVLTQNVTIGLVGNSSTLFNQLVTYSGQGLTTFASLIPLAALALIGFAVLSLLIAFAFRGGNRA